LATDHRGSHPEERIDSQARGADFTSAEMKTGPLWPISREGSSFRMADFQHCH
jgi:hypothetical protein